MFLRDTETTFTQYVLKKVGYKILYQDADCREIMRENGVKIADIIEFCGGIPSPSVSFVKILFQTNSQHSFTVQIDTDMFCSKRSFDFEQKVVYNEKLVLWNPDDKGTNIGCMMLINQIKKATSLNFTKILLYAKGGVKSIPPGFWNGHYSWARLGFLMSPSYYPIYEKHIANTEFANKSLRSLMKTKKGRLFWKNNGCSWLGTFDTQHGSESMSILRKHLIRKGILIDFQ